MCGVVYHLRPRVPQASGNSAAQAQQRSRTLRPRCPRGLSTRVSADSSGGGGLTPPLTDALGPHCWAGPFSLACECCGCGGSNAPLARDAGLEQWWVPPRWNTAVAPVTGQGGVRAGRVGGVDFSSRPSALPFLRFPLHLPRRGQPPGGECNGVCPSPVPGSGLKGRAGPTPRN